MKYFLLSIFIVLFVRLFPFYFFPLSLKNNQEISFTATLFDDPKVLGNSQTFFLSFGNFWQHAKIQIRTSSDNEFSYGQRIRVIGKISTKLLKNNQTIMTIQNPQIVPKNSEFFEFLPFFGALRAKIISFCENNFSQPYSGLLVGIIFGIKSLLTDEITRSFRITGLAHIVAASGMNVTLVAGFLIALLGSFLKRRVAIGVSIVGIFVYTLLSGLDPSIVRAAFMGSIAFSAGLFGRQYSGAYVLFLVGGGMLFWDPLLLSDVGFQLSILATTGILLLKPVLFNNTFFGDDFGTTFAAQLTTLPVILSTFGQYSLLALITNLLVVWTIPLIMTIGGIGIVIGLFIQPLGKVIIWLIIPLLWYMQEVTSFFSLHSLSIHTENLPIALIIGYYFLLGGLLLFLRKKLEYK